MELETLRTRADALRALHRPGEPLVLPNAWDAASARLVVGAGFAAVATSSAAVAASLGYEDNENTPPREVFAALARIARVANIPITADVESGYGMSPEQLVEALVDAGMAGCNVEDSDPKTRVLLDPVSHAKRLYELRRAADAADVPIVINARIDVWIRTSASPKDQLADGLRRARIYRDAGVDCVYPIELKDLRHVAAFAAGAGLPVNVVSECESARIAALRDAGIARISFGGGIFRSVETHLADLLADIRRRLDA